MYQTPIIAHGFNRQSFYRQPISSLRQINEVAWNRKNETDPNAHVTIVNQQFVPEYENLENKFYSSVNGSNEVQKYLSKAVVNYHENGLSKNLPETMETGHSSTRQSRPINTTYGTNQDRLLARQSSLRAAPETKNISSQEAITLFNSRSAGAIHDYIQKERRSHTMAPLVRIVGPSSTITTQTFASTTAPSDAQTVKPSNATQIISNATDNLYAQLNAEMADATNNDYEVDVIGNNQEDDEEEEDDDDTPLIVKVQYDPDAGGPPSEDAIRQALDNKLKGQSRPRNANEPIVLNFLNNSTQTQIPSMRMRPQQPMFNRSAPSIPQSIIRSQQQQQQQQSLLQQQLKQQQQLELQENQRQQQQQLELQENQRQQQQQLELQENQRQQQQRQQQEFLLQQQKQKQQLQQYIQQQQKQKQQLQQYIQQQLQLEQQRKQEQTRRERLQWEQQQIQKQLKAEQQKIQKQLKAEQNELKQLIQQQLQHEQQQQQQQRYQQLFQQQRNRQIYQSQQNESIQQNASLPPMGHDHRELFHLFELFL